VIILRTNGAMVIVSTPSVFAISRCRGKSSNTDGRDFWDAEIETDLLFVANWQEKHTIDQPTMKSAQRRSHPTNVRPMIFLQQKIH
jgi:hypothetical protein